MTFIYMIFLALHLYYDFPTQHILYIHSLVLSFHSSMVVHKAQSRHNIPHRGGS